jgi:hypothetical protein
LDLPRSRQHDRPFQVAPEKKTLPRPISLLSTGYRLKKYVRRHRRLLATLGAFGLVLLAATALSMVMAIQATSARKQSEKQKQLALASFEEAERERKEAEKQTARADRARLESDVAKFASQIRLADENYSKVNSSEAKRILESTDPELRDWEYERLNTVWDSRQKTFAKDRGYRCVAITPDGRLQLPLERSVED